MGGGTPTGTICRERIESENLIHALNERAHSCSVNLPNLYSRAGLSGQTEDDTSVDPKNKILLFRQL